MFTKLTLAAVITITSSAAALAANPQEGGANADPVKAVGIEGAVPTQLDGLWPSPKLMDLLLRRWAQEVGIERNLSDEQRAKVETAFVGRWTTFLRENRTRIQPLLNEFIELRLEMEAPKKERVQDWARRAAPVFREIHAQVDGAMSDFRAVLTPIQQAKFDLDIMPYGLALVVAKEQLQKWQDGDYPQEEFWEATGPERRQRREARKKARAESRRQREARAKQSGKGRSGSVAEQPAPVSEDQITLELVAWEEYVAAFIRVYDLDEAQRVATLSCLAEIKQRARAHRDRRMNEIAKLEQKIRSHAGSIDDLVEIKKLLTELYGPVDEMFLELKHRIEQIPTAKQRAKVVESRRANGINAPPAKSMETKALGSKTPETKKSESPKKSTPPATKSQESGATPKGDE